MASPVDTIIQAAAGQSIDWSHFDVCTYRNNMNKVLMTPICPRDGWELDCCYHEKSGTLFLDIVYGQQATWKDADKFTFYGYKFEAVCTGASQHQNSGTMIPTSGTCPPLRYPIACQACPG